MTSPGFQTEGPEQPLTGPLRFRALGSLDVDREGQAVNLGGRKQRTVLGVLLLHAGRVVSVDRLTEALWGQDQPPSAVATLQAYVSNLRRLLRDDVTRTSPISRRSMGYVLTVPAQQVDLSEFVADADAARSAVRQGDWARGAARAQQGLDRWRGPLLGDLRSEQWLQAEAAALEERRIECGESLIASLLALDRISEAVGQAGVLAQNAPFGERACWLRMVSLHRAGRSPEALAVYRDHAALLDEELALQPGTSLRDLQTAILRQDPALLNWPRDPARQGAAPVDADPTPGFVGRARELALLTQTWEKTLAGQAQWLVLTGPAGIGKSSLAREATVRWQAAGGRVIRVACPEDNGLPPWWPVRALLRSLGADADAVLTPPGGLEVDEARFAVADRVEAVLAETARSTPLLVLVDDVQWADAASLHFLTQLVTLAAGDAIALVLTLRDDSLTPAVQRLQAAISAHPAGHRLPIPALTPQEVAQLAGAVGGEPLNEMEVRELVEKTGGNPFFVTQYARLPAAERAAGQVPAGVRAVLGRRLATLSPAALNMLRSAAVIGDPFPPDVLLAVLDLQADPLADLLEEATGAGMIDVAPASDAYVFTHWLLREEVLLGLPSVRKRRMHASIAQALHDGSGADYLERRATHLVAALPYLDANPVYQACRQAALEATSRWNSDSAAHWWGIALQVFPYLQASARSAGERDELVQSYVTALARAGRDQMVLDMVDSELLLAGREGRTESIGRLAAALLRTAGGWPWVSYAADPQQLLTRLMSIESLVQEDASARVRVLAALAVGSCYDADPYLADDLSGQALTLAEACCDPEVLADALLARALVFCGVTTRVSEVTELLDRLRGIPHAQAPIDDVLSHNMLCWAEMTSGDIDAADKHLRLGIGGCDLLQLPVARVQLRWAEGTIAQWRGDFDKARAIYRHAYDLHRKTELYGPGVYHNAMLTLQWNQGAAYPETPAYSEVDHASVPWAHIAERVAAGEPKEADRLIGQYLSTTRPVTWLTYGTLTMLGHLVADLRLSRHADQLIKLLRPASGRIATIGHVGVVGPVALAVARLHHLLGEQEPARRELATALGLAEQPAGAAALTHCRALAEQLAASS